MHNTETLLYELRYKEKRLIAVYDERYGRPYVHSLRRCCVFAVGLSTGTLALAAAEYC